MQDIHSPKFDFAFGEAVAVREVLANFYSPHMGEHNAILSLRDMGYPGSGPGLDELVESTKEIIEGETGVEYEYVIITAGAAQAILVALHAGKYEDIESPAVRFAFPYFSHYETLAELAGYSIWDANKPCISTQVDLIDSPSNPEGIIRPEGYKKQFSFDRGPLTIWDATYASRVYTKLLGVQPAHKAMIGSFGKLFGLNGVRLGWIATNNEYLFERMTKINYLMTLGVSVPSQRLVQSVIENIDMDKFTKEASLQIDCNREEMSKLEYLSMDGSKIPVNGMFYWSKMDEAARGLLKLAGVKWIEGSTCGGAPEHLRLNLAQSRKLTQDMVRAVRKLDGKK